MMSLGAVSLICDNEPRRPRPGDFDPRIAVVTYPRSCSRFRNAACLFQCFCAVRERAREALEEKCRMRVVSPKSPSASRTLSPLPNCGSIAIEPSLLA
jgi:hypothetical protein